MMNYLACVILELPSSVVLELPGSLHTLPGSLLSQLMSDQSRKRHVLEQPS